ncbi:MAG TPA: EamA family transporter, partial [Ilumatobacteraceae bacterium]|nr:EamA family transporter [Ilumatobacteraceae bacterium]
RPDNGARRPTRALPDQVAAVNAIGDIGFAVFHGAVLIVVGTLLFNIGSRTVPAVAITVLAQSEIAFAPVWVYIALGEAPGIRSLIGGSIIVGAVIGKALFDARPMRVLANQDLLEAPPQSGPAAV